MREIAHQRQIRHQFDDVKTQTELETTKSDLSLGRLDVDDLHRDVGERVERAQDGRQDDAKVVELGAGALGSSDGAFERRLQRRIRAAGLADLVR